MLPEISDGLIELNEELSHIVSEILPTLGFGLTVNVIVFVSPSQSSVEGVT